MAATATSALQSKCDISEFQKSESTLNLPVEVLQLTSRLDMLEFFSGRCISVRQI
jgi:hypothetical protein